MTDQLVLHHDDPDGFCCAWILHHTYPDAEYIAVNYGEDLSEDVKDFTGDLYILDFSYSEEVLDKLYKQHPTLLVIDHHKTSSWLKDKVYAVWNVDQAACMLTWQNFGRSLELKTLVEYVQDHDLWVFKKKNSKLIRNKIQSTPYLFQAWDELNLLFSGSHEQLIAEAKAIQDFKEILIHEAVMHSSLIVIDGIGVLATCCPFHSLTSEIGERLAARCESRIGLVWETIGSKTTIHLRSRGKYDVSAIAKEHGGGGHNFAAGFIDTEHKYF